MSGTSPGRSSTPHSGAARHWASSWPARRRSRSVRRWRASPWAGSSDSALGIIFVHSRLAERAFVPYVVASQTVPILAIAPLVVVALKADWLSVDGRRHVPDVLPGHDRVDAGSARLRPALPRAVPVVCRDPATGALAAPACRRRCRTCSRASGSPRPHRSSARSSASRRRASPSGLGSAIINYNQYYTSGPERLWATIVMCTLVGFVFVGHRQPRPSGSSREDATDRWRDSCDHRADNGRRPRGPGDRGRGDRRRQGVRRRRWRR